MAHYELELASAGAERKRIELGQFSLFDIQDSAAPKLELGAEAKSEFVLSELLAMEHEATGVYISGHPLMEYEKELSEMKQSCKMLNDAEESGPITDGSAVRVGGIIASVKTRPIKNGSGVMATGVLEDMNGTVEFLAFPTVYQKCAQLLLKDKRVILTGRLSMREDKPNTVMVDDAVPLIKLDTRRLALNFTAETEPLKKRVIEALRRFPGTVESRVAHLRFADTLLAVGEAEAAEREFTALLQAYPEHALDVHVMVGRGWALLEMGRRTEAVGLFSRAAQAATNATDKAVCIFKQGDALLADGRFKEAADAYSRVPPEGGTNLFLRARFQKADALARAEHPDDAQKIFAELSDMKGDAELAFAAGLRMAALESAACRFERAIEIYTKLLKDGDSITDSKRVDVLHRRGKALYGAYRFAEAEADFAAVAKLQPSRAAEMAYLSALCLYGAGRDEDAAAAVRKLLASDDVAGSLRAEVEFWLAKYEFAHRNYPTALAGFLSCATNASLSAGSRIESLGRAARCCAAQSDYAGVVEFATRATTNAIAVRAIAKKTPETAAVAEAFVLQGEALMELARFNEAVLVLSRAQRLDAPQKTLRRAAVLKADCLFAMGADDDRRYLQALDAYRALLRDESLTPSQRLAVAFKVGRTLEKLRRFEEAADQYYAQVVMAYYDGVNANTWFDGDACAFFTRAVFILADYYEARGEVRPAIRVLEYLTGVPAAREARKRIQRLEAKKKGGVW